MFDLAVGEAAFLKLAATDHQRCLADPVLSHPFSHEGHPEMSSDLPATGPKSSGCGFRAIPYTRSDRIRTPIPTFSYTR